MGVGMSKSLTSCFSVILSAWQEESPARAPLRFSPSDTPTPVEGTKTTPDCWLVRPNSVPFACLRAQP